MFGRSWRHQLAQDSHDLGTIFATYGATDSGVRFEVVESGFSAMAVAALDCDLPGLNPD